MIAVIAVYYPHPYEPTDRELVLVQAAVSLVALSIAHSTAQSQLKESLTRVELAQSIARLGYWERDLSSDKLNIYGEANAILGIPGERAVGLDAFLGVVLEADRPALIAAYGEARRPPMDALSDLSAVVSPLVLWLAGSVRTTGRE